MALAPRPLPWLLPATLVPVAAALIAHPLLVHSLHSFPALEISAGFSLLAFVGCLYVVPSLGPAFISKGLKGKDMLKTSSGDVCVPPAAAAACSLHQARPVLTVPPVCR